MREKPEIWWDRPEVWAAGAAALEGEKPARPADAATDAKLAAFVASIWSKYGVETDDDDSLTT